MKQMGFAEIRRLIDREGSLHDEKLPSRIAQGAEAQADDVGGRLATELRTHVTPSSGPLPASVRDRAEQQLGVDLSSVQLRAGVDGEHEALEHGAFAVTEGSTIHFAQGQLSTESEHGRQLLGHELVHAAQARAEASLGASLFPRLGLDDAGVSRVSAKPALAAPAAAAQARSFPRIHEQILQALIQARGDDPSFGRVKSLLSGLSKEEAQGLLTRLTSGSRRDDFALYFNDDRNVPPAVRDELLAMLRERSGETTPAAALPLAHGATESISANQSSLEQEREPETRAEPLRGSEPPATAAIAGFSAILDVSVEEARAHPDWVDTGIHAVSTRNDVLELLYSDGSLLELPLSTIFDAPLGNRLTFVRRHLRTGKLIPFAISRQGLEAAQQSGPAGPVLESLALPRFDPQLTPEVFRLAANEFALFAGQAVAGGARELAERALTFRFTARSMQAARSALAGEAATAAEAEGARSTASEAHRRTLKAALSTGSLAAGVNAATQLVTLDDFGDFDWGSVAIDFVAGALLSAYTGEVVRHFGIKATTLRGLLNVQNARLLIKQQGFIAPALILANSLRADALGSDRKQALSASAVDVALGALQSAVVQTLLQGRLGDLIFKGKNIPVAERINTPQAVLLKKAISFLRTTISRLLLTASSGEKRGGEGPP